MHEFTKAEFAKLLKKTSNKLVKCDDDIQSSFLWSFNPDNDFRRNMCHVIDAMRKAKGLLDEAYDILIKQVSDETTIVDDFSKATPSPD